MPMVTPRVANLGVILLPEGSPTVSANLLVQLDDDALTGGNAGGVGDDPNAVNTTGTLAHSYGADGAGTTLLTALAFRHVLTAALHPGGEQRRARC